MTDYCAYMVGRSTSHYDCTPMYNVVVSIRVLIDAGDCVQERLLVLIYPMHTVGGLMKTARQIWGSRSFAKSQNGPNGG